VRPCFEERVLQEGQRTHECTTEIISVLHFSFTYNCSRLLMRIVCVGEGAGDKAEGTGAETPEELEFEDDDGTMYVWDRTRRKYMPKVE